MPISSDLVVFSAGKRERRSLPKITEPLPHAEGARPLTPLRFVLVDTSESPTA